MGRKFELRKEVELAATPQQVWDAISTGPGLEAWFMSQPAPEEGACEVWQPGEHLSITTPAGPDGSFHAFEYLIEARDGGSTVLRFVHSGFLSDDWGAEFEGMTARGWDMYLHTLALYLAHFAGRPAVYVTAEGPEATAKPEAWAVLLRGLGLDHNPALGERVRLTPEGLPAIDGEVDWFEGEDSPFLAVRTADALYRFHGRAPLGMTIAVGHHFYVPAEQPATNEAWRVWLHGLYPDQG
ncbi:MULTISPECIES: SRPBCC domain-containing protein [unclassified Crossiella]|uniref:SRPBCC family protein n=1 Tax=unclassified Crossiella TaxID=2620835 RepID=UPI0020005A8A|nr:MULTISPECIES: SRPBCC domain-containing protein [unclassified Crossiella]MCK2238544.1 SRPBCC domain-containing protein [Crossiella sp. S99.2]MCK2251886.1 SRPBCC domain-containing protein [Crossiella sp. S99.1]